MTTPCCVSELDAVFESFADEAMDDRKLSGCGREGVGGKNTQSGAERYRGHEEKNHSYKVYKGFRDLVRVKSCRPQS